MHRGGPDVLNHLTGVAVGGIANGADHSLFDLATHQHRVAGVVVIEAPDRWGGCVVVGERKPQALVLMLQHLCGRHEHGVVQHVRAAHAQTGGLLFDDPLRDVTAAVGVVTEEVGLVGPLLLFVMYHGVVLEVGFLLEVAGVVTGSHCEHQPHTHHQE